MGRSGARAKNISAAVKLREALRLDNNFAIFEEFRNNIRLIGKEFLDMNKTACCQQGALMTIRKELAGRYPDILGGDNTSRLDLAVDVVKQHHTNSRCAAKKKLENEKERIRQAIKRKERVAEVGNSGPYVEYLEPTKFSEPPSSFGFNRPTLINGGVPATPSNLKTCRTDTAATTPGFIAPSNSKPSGKVYPATPRRPINSVSQTTPGTHLRKSIRSEDCGYESSDSDQPLALERRRQLRSAVPPTAREANVDVEPQPTQAVYHFLDNCVPSMAHLFEDFIEYGCDSEEFLLGISSWPPNLIAKFIHNISRRTGTHISEMETDIIQVQFMTYYKD